MVTLFLIMLLMSMCMIEAQKPKPAPAQYMLENLEPNPDSPPFMQPRVIRDQTNINLSVEVFRFEDIFEFNTRAYCYNGTCSIPGPTIHMKPGDIITLTLINNLAVDDTSMVMNTLHSPNRTNIHTHGLHVSPHEDNVFVSTSGGGDTHTYVYHIPSDHAPGNHWYHAHFHGSSAYQVMGGLAAALIIEPSDINDMPSELNAMTRNTVVLQHIFLDNEDGEEDADAAFTSWSYTHLNTDIGSTLPIDPIYHSTVRDAWFTNGQFQPTHEMAPGEWQIFDIVVASGDRIIELEIRTAIGIENGDNACEVVLLGLDGVYLNTSRSSDDYAGVRHLTIVQAGRASIAVMCEDAGIYYMQSAATTDDAHEFGGIADAEIKSAQNLLVLNVTGSSVSMSRPPLYLDTPKPDYLNSLLDVPSASEWSIGVAQGGCCAPDDDASFWLGIGEDCSNGGACDFEAFIGEQGESGNYRHTAIDGVVETLTLHGGGASGHPIHIHVNHFQIVSYDGADLSLYSEVGDWRDTFPALAGVTTLKTIYTDYPGEIVMHCHFMRHEDTGMMSTFQMIAAPSSAPTLAPTTSQPTQAPSSSEPTISHAPTSVPTAAPTLGPTLPKTNNDEADTYFGSIGGEQIGVIVAIAAGGLLIILGSLYALTNGFVSAASATSPHAGAKSQELVPTTSAIGV